MVHMPYKGAAAAAIGLMTREIDLVFASIPAALPQIKARKIKPLGLGLPKRNSAMPNVPTIDESGLP